jgi:hypothetical protein
MQIQGTNLRRTAGFKLYRALSATMFASSTCFFPLFAVFLALLFKNNLCLKFKHCIWLKSVHYVEAKNGFVAREYRDATMLTASSQGMPTPTSTTYPQQNADGNMG